MNIKIVNKGTCEKFKENLLLYSNSKCYDTAKNEWELIGSYKGESCCICGHKKKNLKLSDRIYSFIPLNN